ncbi:CTP synthase [Rhodanobacter terrae]|uniref:CTP synthase (glutamine hydrolyzing) n=1 Tax=Rhodanobacter terrae TaxID=418647 RepID=A0ABW0SYX9_9GAMM
MHLLQIGLIGDRNDDVVAHRAIPLALGMAADACGVAIEPVWVPTDEVGTGAALAELDGLWCVPASPYRSMDGALAAIRVARERHIPFLGTCGGFQHAMIEYARNVLGWDDAEHAETAPQATRQVIVPLLCSLVEVTDAVQLVADSRLAQAYGTTAIAEGYHCNYGLSPGFRQVLDNGPLRINAVDDAGDVRGVELDDHPFFIATLFQHERGALQGRLPPAVHAFVQAAIAAG